MTNTNPPDDEAPRETDVSSTFPAAGSPSLPGDVPPRPAAAPPEGVNRAEEIGYGRPGDDIETDDDLDGGWDPELSTGSGGSAAPGWSLAGFALVILAWFSAFSISNILSSLLQEFTTKSVTRKTEVVILALPPLVMAVVGGLMTAYALILVPPAGHRWSRPLAKAGVVLGALTAVTFLVLLLIGVIGTEQTRGSSGL